MSSVSRSVRNVFRNKARTLVVVMIIGLSMGVFLTMSVVNANISENTASLSDGIDTTITVRPAGNFGFMSTKTIAESNLTDIESVDHIISVQKLLIKMESGGLNPQGKPMRIPIEGLDPSLELVLFSGGTITLDEGRSLDAGDVDAAVAIVGSQYAADNGAYVGSNIYINGSTQVEVVGIFSTGNRFGDMTILLPLSFERADLVVHELEESRFHPVGHL